MYKFWPAFKNTKSGPYHKFYSENLEEILLKELFYYENKMVDVPKIKIQSEEKNISKVKININFDSFPKEYKNLNWKNVNYILSDFNVWIPDIKYSFWYVENSKISFNSNGEPKAIEYELLLDYWHTNFKNNFNLNGMVEVLEANVNRFILDKDGNYIPNIQNYPEIRKCNNFCINLNSKEEKNRPIQILDSKHITFEKEILQNKDFFVVQQNIVEKQIRGWVLVWADKNGTNENVISKFDDLVIPFKMFIYPIYNSGLNQRDWMTGIKEIGKNYTIQYSNIIADILNYDDLSPLPNTKWYQSTSNSFRLSKTNGIIIDDNFHQKGIFNAKEIIETHCNPHILSNNHLTFNLSNINKNNIEFDLLSIFSNKTLFRKPPNIEFQKIEPIVKNISEELLNVYLKNKHNFYFYKNASNENTAVLFDGINDWIYSTKGKLTFEDFLKNAKKSKKLEWYGGYPDSSSTTSPKPKGGKICEFGEKALTSNKLPLTYAYWRLKKWPSRSTEYRPLGNVVGWDSKFETQASWGETIMYYWMEAITKSFQYPNFSLIGPHIINMGFNINELYQSGNYDYSVLNWDIIEYKNGKYHTKEWYVLYDNDVYKLPIGRYPAEYLEKNNENHSYPWYENNVFILTKNYSMFSNEGIGYKNILLDTISTVEAKLLENKMTLNTIGTYSYAWFTDGYIEFMKTNLNQKNAAFNAIELKRKFNSEEMIFKNLDGLLAQNIKSFTESLVKLPFSLSSGIKQNNMQANIEKEKIQAFYKDMENLPNNISTTGISDILHDLLLKSELEVKTYLKNYYNYWSPVLQIKEIRETEKENILLHFNKYGHNMHKFINIESLKDLMPMRYWNRLKIINMGELLQNTGLNYEYFNNEVESFAEGVWMHNLDTLEWDEILDFTKVNVESEIYDDYHYALNENTTLEAEMGVELDG